MRPLRRLMAELESGQAPSKGIEAKLGDIELADIEGAIKVTTSTASADADKYNKFSQQFGQVLS